MSIDAWMTLWKVVLIGGIGLFAVLAVVVTIGGFFDVIKLLKNLREDAAAADAEAATEASTNS
ncbi:MAG: hypothetical protein GY794_10535 [bacterium]|nr:hypothetical protein [bacterium]